VISLSLVYLRHWCIAVILMAILLLRLANSTASLSLQNLVENSKLSKVYLNTPASFQENSRVISPAHNGHASLQNQDEAACVSPQNPIVVENCQAGTTDWYVTNYWGDIEGFASATSVDSGETIEFHINTNAPAYDLLVFRTGYYGGTGGRLVKAFRGLPGQVQPACYKQYDTGLTSCSNWSVSLSLTIPEDWVSGIYIGKLIRPDTGGENLIHFVVRDDQRHAPILLQQSITTYQAYNDYGDKSLYSSIVANSCLTVAEAPRAVQASFDRPNHLYPYAHNSYAWSDFPMVYWLEGQGYDVSYVTNIDTHRSGKAGQNNELLNHQVFLSVGHDEYWSQEMRDAITQARDASVSLGFFSSNVSYWRIRLEPDPWSGEPDRVIVSYKTTESGSADPSGHPTGTWRDPEGANNPENELIGIQYVGDNDVDYFPLRVKAEQAQDPLYRHTGLEQMPPGSYVDIGRHLIGWEWDAVADNGHTPSGLVILAESPVHGTLLTDAGRTYALGKAEANVTRYTAPSGAKVFAAGTNQWAWGLALFEPDRRIQQMTYNLLADMGVYPATPAKTLVLDENKAVNSIPQDFIESVEVNQLSLITGVQEMLELMGTQADLGTKSETTAEVVRPVEEGTDPVITNLKVSSTSNTVTIAWETDRPATSQVWIKIKSGQIDYRLSGESGWLLPVAASTFQGNLQQQHEITLTNLDPNTQYYYQVASADEWNRASISTEASFQTASGSLVGQAKTFFRMQYRLLPCWARANQLLIAIGVGITMIGILGLGAWQIFMFSRRASRT
jgi:hypothetical protein